MQPSLIKNFDRKSTEFPGEKIKKDFFKKSEVAVVNRKFSDSCEDLSTKLSLESNSSHSSEDFLNEEPEDQELNKNAKYHLATIKQNCRRLTVRV